MLKEVSLMVESLIMTDKKFYIKDSTFTIGRYIEPLKEFCYPHTHDFVEICYVCSGSGYHLVDNKEYKVFKGDLFIINYDMAHTFYSISEDNPVITYNIMFKPGFLDEILINLNDFNGLPKSFLFKNLWDEDYSEEDLRLNSEEQKDFDYLIGNMYREYTLQQDGYMNIIRAYIIELIVKIMRFYKDRAENEKSIRIKSSFIDTIIRHLHENYDKSLSLNELALKSFFSKNYICKVFKETTGTTITEYLQLLRINEACTLLETTDKKIVEIGLEVGFSDYKAFNTLFKRVKGMLPKEYRANYKKSL